LLASLRRPDARVALFSAKLHFFFDHGSDDSIAEIGAFLFELDHLAIPVSENLFQALHYFPLLELRWVAGNAIFSRDGCSVKSVVSWPLALA
jgi:hypothetical protein